MTETTDGAVTAAELDELTNTLWKLKGEFNRQNRWADADVAGQAQNALAALRKQLDEARRETDECEAEKDAEIAALLRERAKKDAALRDIRERAVLMMSGRYTYCQLIIERCDAALAQPAPASQEAPGSPAAVSHVLSQFACKLSEWKDEHHDCDCPPHDGCGCHELRGIIQEMEFYGFTEEDAKQMLSPAPASPSPGLRDECCHNTVQAHCEDCPYVPVERCTCFRCIRALSRPVSEREDK